MINLLHETYKLEKELKNNKYKERPHRVFKVLHPKKRDIVSISFRDRVYNRSLNDEVIYPSISKSLIFENAACQKNKGTDFARRLFESDLKKAYRKFGTDFWIMKIDIRQYYKSMVHTVAKETFKEHLTDIFYNRAAKVLDSYDGDVGYDPGSQMIQLAGISVLSTIDHYIKEKLHVKYYVRYMDDMIFVHQSREFLFNCLRELDNKLSELGFMLHDDRKMFFKPTDGILFLGFIFRLANSGKIVKTVDPIRVKSYRKKIFRLVQIAKSGRYTKEKVDECYKSFRSHVAKADSFKLLLRLDKHYKSLWR